MALQKCKNPAKPETLRLFSWTIKSMDLCPISFSSQYLPHFQSDYTGANVPKWPGIDKYIEKGKSCKAKCMQQVLSGRNPQK